MKKAIAAGLVVGGLILGLTGCGDKTYLSESEKFRMCVENGGSWQSGAWGEESCTMPDVKMEDAEGAAQ